MKTRFSLPLILLLVLLPGAATAASIPPIAVNRPNETALGLSTSYLKEADARLTLNEAIAAFAGGRFSAGDSQVLDFGIGSKPVWVHFSVDNSTTQALARRLSVETAWLDQLDVYILHGGKTAAAWHVGDTKAFNLRPVDSRYFLFDHSFEPGLSDVFIRVETPDPMVVPIYMMPPSIAQDRERADDYSYGFLYGFLIALMAYNAMLYAGLRQARYILYSLYLGMFMLANLSYTGHGFRWLWPSHTTWEQWSNPVLMVAYGASGLLFALRFLDTRRHFPRVHKAVLGFISVSCLLLLLSILFNSQRDALLVAFSFVCLFTFIMLGLGMISVGAGQRPARYFLLAAISAMVGAALTALAVWGFIPFNTWTFRAVDVGVLLDATLLALALTYQFRVGQAERLHAVQLATTDPLTGINNRRAFYDKAISIWNIALRHDHKLSLILFDIDRFKQINDAHGHARGDELLIATAAVFEKTIRKQDVAARWGGEEFMVLLPETGLPAAAALAERLRKAIAAIRLQDADAEFTVTASFGVAQREPHHQNLDAVISVADKYLYQSKTAGRNTVSHA